MKSLADCAILIVEDEVLIAMSLELLLSRAGCRIVGPEATVANALRALKLGSIDACVLDINLGEELSFPVADLLEEMQVPFVMLTGHSQGLIPPRHRLRPLLSKPHDPVQLTTLLAGLVAQTQGKPQLDLPCHYHQ